ncbi:MAG: endo-1,4-beta-xylanase [Cellvibrio sp.]
MQFKQNRHYRLALAIAGLCGSFALPSLAACTYTVNNEWPDGFVATITITNDTDAPLNSWDVAWQYASNRVASSWNANVSGTNPYRAQGLSWNSSIGVGQSASFGIQGVKNGANAERPTITGSACQSTGTPPPASSSSSTSSSQSSSNSSGGTARLTLQESASGFCSVQGTIDNNHTGFTGSGFANTDNHQGASITWAATAQTYGTYRISFRYANGGTSARSGSLLVNGGANGDYTVNLPTTAGWDDWRDISLDIDLERGNNTLQLRATGAEGLANIDSLTINGTGLSTGECPIASSSSSSSSSSSQSPRKFVGNITTSGAVRSDFAQYWNQITPENEGKWGSVEGTRDVYNWAPLDRIYAYARANNIPVKAHTFVWGNQAPSWINNLSPAEQAAEIEEWIRDYCARYPDTAMIDVVNESTPGHAPAEFARRAFGENWIIKSFQLARQYCPNSILILNDYNVLSWNTNEFIAMAQPVIRAGVVDAIGMQAHGLEDRPFSDIQAKFNRIAALGLPMYISEYDIAKTDDQTQLRIMQQQFPFFYEHPQVHGITLWGYIYGRTWVTGSGLIHENGVQRPAMVWLRQYLESQP